MLIGLMGDIMIGRLVNKAISQYGYDYPWGNVLSLLKEQDINLINLETTLTKNKIKTLKVFNFKADPDKVQTLANAKITITNLANNHILDFGEAGLLETIQVLDRIGIEHVGAGSNLELAQKPVIIEKENSKIGFIGCTDNESEWCATATKLGTYYLKVGDLNKIENNIRSLREQVDILILTTHWGPNNQQEPSTLFQKFAHQLIDCGVDIFHGHSAHIVQGIEIYKNKLILYDTGDFVDDYMVDPILRNDLSFLFQVSIKNKKLQQLTLVPVTINNRQVNQSNLQDSKFITNRMKELSRNFGTEFLENNQILSYLFNNS